jgi:hypothetical protein
MTEVYGHFFYTLEYINFPNSDSDTDSVASDKQTKAAIALQKGTDAQKKTIVNHFFKTMEKLNLGQYGSTESLPSLQTDGTVSSSSSMSSLRRTLSQSSVASEEDAAEMFFTAVQKLTLNNYGSSNSLADLDGNEHKSRVQEFVKLFVPEFVREFIGTYDEFMHNHDRSQPVETGSVDEPSCEDSAGGGEEETETVFPKLC